VSLEVIYIFLFFQFILFCYVTNLIVLIFLILKEETMILFDFG
jgi:hypothetical protein